MAQYGHFSSFLESYFDFQVFGGTSWRVLGFKILKNTLLTQLNWYSMHPILDQNYLRHWPVLEMLLGYKICSLFEFLSHIFEFFASNYTTKNVPKSA